MATGKINNIDPEEVKRLGEGYVWFPSQSPPPRLTLERLAGDSIGA